MCILSDSDITSLVSSGQLIEENYSEQSLTPNGYDLRVGSVVIGDEGSLPAEEAEVPAGRWFAISTIERVGMPGDITGQLWIRSTYARKGVISSFGKVDAGFRGVLTLTCYNASTKALKLEKGTRFVQIVFEKMCTHSRNGYGERSGNYQGQDSLTLEPIRKGSS